MHKFILYMYTVNSKKKEEKISDLLTVISVSTSK